jgi:endonuclease/exonuclease/phosphatase family metal-dependent hydrolase
MISKIYSQNVHKNRKWTQHLLETLVDKVDIIMLQEPPRYHVKDIPSGKSKEGEPEHDTSHHSAWSKIFFHTNVSVYLSEKTLKTHSLFLFPSIDQNIIAFTLQQINSGERFNFINCYNDLAQPTLQRLLDFLDREDLPHLVLMGDFNLHSPKWDLNIERADAKAEALINHTV